MLRPISVCVFSICCFSTLFGQDLRDSKKSVASNAEQLATEQFDAPQQRLDLYRFRGIVDEILALHDVQAKALGAAQVADLLWKYDEAGSRQLFERILSLTSAEANPEKRELLANLRQRVLVILARRDGVWAKRLIDASLPADLNDNLSWQSDTNLAIATTLLTDRPEMAADFATRSLHTGVNPSLIWFLKELRRTDPGEADRIFLQALARFPQQRAPDVNGLAMLGTYIFTSPKATATDPTNIIITRVGNVGIVDLTADQPGVSPALVRSFLNSAIEILSRQTPDPYQRQTSYALGYLLLPKARLYAPDLLASLGAAMSALSSSIPAGMTHESTYANMGKIRPSDREILSRAEGISDPQSRDIAYLDVAFHAWLEKDFATARNAAGKIDAEEPRASLRVLTDFGEGTTLLSQPNRLVDAEHLANKLPRGIERALLFLGIGHAARKSGDTTKATEAVRLALHAAPSINDVRRPFVILIAAGQLAELDPSAARLALANAIREFNQQEDAAFRDVSWKQKVEIGPLVERFPLSVDGIEFGFGPAFRSTIPASLDDAVFMAKSLKNEGLRARAFIEIGKAILSSVSTSEQTNGIVVRVGEDGMRKSAAKTVMPVYPDEAKKSGQQGVAVVEAQYNGKGDVTHVAVLEVPAATIGQAVSSAVRQWKFKPSTLKGEPINVRGKLTFYFVIDEDGKSHVENPKQFQ